MYGYHGQILNVDLTSGTSEVERYGEAFARAYLGGNGFAVRLLYDRMAAGTDPYDPASLAVFACGPISDTPVFGSSRAYTACKSPLTGRYFDSTFGGRFAQTLKRTGFEAVA
ncbi:MAG: aldehyde:ferredoxin oxidoreductase, partial [Proteobacteria bacterium]|nr:aldehyde:ferredoxin oxidoreductase [Pseudomonadota bacterium]